MNSGYFIESSLLFFLFIGLYKIFLEDHRDYIFKRQFLIITLLLATLVPLWTFPVYYSVIEEIIPLGIASDSAIEVFSTSENCNDIPLNWSSIFGIGYFTGMFFFLGKLIIEVYAWQKLIVNNEQEIKGNYTLVLVNEPLALFSFMRYIFISKEDYDGKKIDQCIIDHEITHIDQHHTIDLLIFEIVKIVFWFNPLIWWYGDQIKLNHEFLCDSEVLKTHNNYNKYQQQLLNFLNQGKSIITPRLASELNFSLTKKRFKMMKYYNLPPAHQWKKPLLTSMVLLICIVFAVDLIGQSDPPPPPPPPPTVAPPPPPPPVAPEAPTPPVKPSEVGSIPKSPPPPPPPPRPLKLEQKTPTQSQIDSWQKQTYTVWVDGQRKDKEFLSKLKPNDVFWYYSTKLMQNAKDTDTDEHQVEVITKEQMKRNKE